MAEAVQVVVACGWWLAVWVVVLSAVGTVGVLAAGGLVWWVGRGLWRAIRARMPRRGPSVPAGAPEGPSCGSRDAGGAERAADGRVRPRPTPTPPGTTTATGPSRPRAPRQSAPQGVGGGFHAPGAPRPSQSRSGDPHPQETP